MRITRSFAVLLLLSPVALAAQRASTAPVVSFDLDWLQPLVRSATSQAAIGLSQAAVALPQTRAAIAQARSGLIRAHAALAGLGSVWPTVSWDFSDEALEQTPPESWAQQDPADQLYRDARSALNRERYTAAADLFGQIYSKYPRSQYAGDAYYWQAWAYYKRGNEESLRNALESIKLQEEKAPNASTRDDARTLATRIRGQLARNGDEPSASEIATTAGRAAIAPPAPPAAGTPRAPNAPPPPVIAGRSRGRNRDECEKSDDMAIEALNAVQQMESSKALPILTKVLARRDDESLCLRRKAVFIVSQQEGQEAERILLQAARSDPDSQVREQAVFWLSQVNSPSAVAALDSILRQSTDPVLQDKAIFALSQQESSKAHQALRDFALRSGVSDDLREKAIFWIGQGDDPDRLEFLKTLYAQIKSQNLRDKILFSVSQIEGRASSQWLLGIAADVNEDIELRKKALFWVGQSDYPFSELTTLYDKMPSREMKEQLIFVYSQRSEKAAVDRLFDIARTETDKALRGKAIFWLGQSGDPRVADFIAKLFEKP